MSVSLLYTESNIDRTEEPLASPVEWLASVALAAIETRPLMISCVVIGFDFQFICHLVLCILSSKINV